MNILNYKKKDLTFGQALQALKKGSKVKREHWKGHWQLCMVDVCATTVIEGFQVPRETPVTNLEFQVHRAKHIIAFTAEGGQEPAQAYQGDMLAEDWCLVE